MKLVKKKRVVNIHYNYTMKKRFSAIRWMPSGNSFIHNGSYGSNESIGNRIISHMSFDQEAQDMSHSIQMLADQ